VRLVRNLTLLAFCLTVLAAWQPSAASISGGPGVQCDDLCSQPGCTCDGWGSSSWQASCTEPYAGNFAADMRETCWSYCWTYFCGIGYLDAENGTCLCAERTSEGGC